MQDRLISYLFLFFVAFFFLATFLFTTFFFLATFLFTTFFFLATFLFTTFFLATFLFTTFFLATFYNLIFRTQNVGDCCILSFRYFNHTRYCMSRKKIDIFKKRCSLFHLFQNLVPLFSARKKNSVRLFPVTSTRHLPFRFKTDD